VKLESSVGSQSQYQRKQETGKEEEQRKRSQQPAFIAGQLE
jgi:hypothetical protein